MIEIVEEKYETFEYPESKDVENPNKKNEKKSFLKKHSLVLYFVFAYGLSWIIWIPVALITSLTAEPPEWLMLLVALGIYGASGAGFIMIYITEGKQGLKKLWLRIKGWRVGLKWYMGAIFAVPLVILGGVALYTLTGNSIGSFAPAQLPLLVLLAFQNILFGPLGEEFGWRGFALPKLQSRFSAFWSSVILGIMHTFWHLPLFFLGGVTFGTIEENGLITIPLFLSWVMIGTFVYTFALNNTKGSLIIAVLIHLMVNSDAIVFGVFPTLSESAQFQIMALAQIPGWIVVLLLILVFGPTNLSRKNKRFGYNMESQLE